MSNDAECQFDKWLSNDGPVALVMGRRLLPVEGKDALIFPPTFAAGEGGDDDGEGAGSAYQIDTLADDPRRNVCLIDSAGSQANRMEPIFKGAPYAELVPQITVMLGADGAKVNMLDAGHRAADALIRFSKIVGPKIFDAFKSYKDKVDCTELAKLAPTSLVFGVWDSRQTGVKIQRIVRSVVRAYNVAEVKRSATFQAACDYVANGLVDERHDKGTGKANPLSQEGFKYSIASRTHGGIVVKGEIRQEAAINLVALRTLTPDTKIRRYLFGLAIVALSYRDHACFNLREGCLLCAASAEDLNGAWHAVGLDGSRECVAVDPDIALGYAKKAAEGFGVGPPITDEFDSKTANGWLAMEKTKRKGLARLQPPSKAVENANTKEAKGSRAAS
jgi:CRISPR-associated protein Csb1